MSTLELTVVFWQLGRLFHLHLSHNVQGSIQNTNLFPYNAVWCLIAIFLLSRFHLCYYFIACKELSSGSHWRLLYLWSDHVTWALFTKDSDHVTLSQRWKNLIGCFSRGAIFVVWLCTPHSRIYTPGPIRISLCMVWIRVPQQSRLVHSILAAFFDITFLWTLLLYKYC